MDAVGAYSPQLKMIYTISDTSEKWHSKTDFYDSFPDCAPLPVK